MARFPGKYLRELQRDLTMAMGSLEYHLATLASAGLITVLEGPQKRFFAADIDRRLKPVLALLRQSLARRAVIRLLADGAVSKSALVGALGVPTSTLNHYLRQLQRAAVVDVEHKDREAVYRLRDPPTVEALVVAYRASFLDRVLDAFLEGTGALR
ncbi:MAG: hypothetical protein HYT80_08235 [Euryarchaeota archaeon]|nr:hypothetical protein [Euryarchaeota archaeon]